MKQKLEALNAFFHSEAFADFKEAVESYRDANYKRAMDSELNESARVNFLEKIKGASEVYGYLFSLAEFYQSNIDKQNQEDKGELNV